MILQALCFVTLILGSLANSCVPPLSDVYEVVKGFPTTDFCGRVCHSKYWMDPGNQRKVTFKGILNCDETARELCQCLYKYMNQNDWLIGAGKRCIHDLCDNSVTLELSGEPDPSYDPNVKNTNLDRPLERMKKVADQFKDNAKLVGLTCKMHWMEDRCKCLHVMVECPVECETRSSEVLCKGIVDYFNQGGWLENSITNCNPNDDNKTLQVEFIGNTEDGVDCSAPTYF